MRTVRENRWFRIRGWCLAGLPMVLGLTAPTAAQEVNQWRWGYDGRVVNERFNRVAVELLNPHPEAVRTRVELRTGVLAGTAGGVVVQDLYLTPGQRRWLDFVVFVQDGVRGAQVAWRDPVLGRRVFQDLDIQPLAGSAGGGNRSMGATVDLRDPDDPLRRAIPKLPTLDPARFPSSLVGADGLARIVLDHPPELDAVRAQVFRDWFRRGGEVVLLRSGGRYPEAIGVLDILQQDAPPEVRGAGLVRRFDQSREQVKDAWKEGLVLMAGQRPNTDAGEFTERMHERFRSRVQPDHQWGGILLLGLLFLVFVGPGHYLLSKRMHYLASLGVLALGILAWTSAFLFLGARGYGESSRVQAVAYIRPLDGERSVVTQWGNLFSTTPGTFPLRLPAASGAWSTGNVRRNVPAVATQGPEALMRAEVPLFSSRSIVHEGVFPLPLGWPAMAPAQGDGGRGGVIRLGPGLPGDAVHGAWLFRDRDLVRLVRSGEREWREQGRGAPADLILQALGERQDVLDLMYEAGLSRPARGRVVPPEADWSPDGGPDRRVLMAQLQGRHPDDTALPALLVRALQLDLTIDTPPGMPRPNLDRVFLWIDLPTEVALSIPELGTAGGRALVDLPVLPQ